VIVKTQLPLFTGYQFQFAHWQEDGEMNEIRKEMTGDILFGDHFREVDNSLHIRVIPGTVASSSFGEDLDSPPARWLNLL